jgi:hypothetical protein
MLRGDGDNPGVPASDYAGEFDELGVREFSPIWRYLFLLISYM